MKQMKLQVNRGGIPYTGIGPKCLDHGCLVLTRQWGGEPGAGVVADGFRARHFQIADAAGNLPEEHPPYDVWCTADDDYLLLKAGVGGYMQTHYELVELGR